MVQHACVRTYVPNSNNEKEQLEKDSDSTFALFFASYLARLLCSPKGLVDLGSRQYAAVGTYTCRTVKK